MFDLAGDLLFTIPKVSNKQLNLGFVTKIIDWHLK